MADIGSQETIKRMLTSIGQRRGGKVSESTKTTFLIYIDRFCEFCGKSPDELIAERVKDWTSDDIFARRRHEELVMNFAEHLSDKGYKSNTISTAVGAIRSFYRTNYHPLIEVNVPSGKPVRIYKVPTREELAQAVEAATVPWYRAFMILTKDCGISLQDMLSLNLEDGSPIYGSIKQQLKKGRVPIHLQIVREKTRYKYDTFLGEDSFKVLNDRENFPRLIAQALSDDGTLFPYSDTAIQEGMGRLGDGFGWKSFTPYSLRKWFRTQLTLENVNEALIEYMMGHSLGKVKEAYLVPPPQKLIEIYEENYDALRL